ncbi:hypothetical protein CEUSTIGMA_g77.t1 [Chlamydomonas eustigma]|uniref:Mitochondrial import inner membrane translocase subunit Tim21 n=1 Tax=Chlamydomonas eustigma TaxID=1157962 RepID=A0A250WPA8_9CHLO|nr:hypothetical protein CEUSTIGMA_g77.t1 [Chlamydomonas eustigma]|eukprot:GAX72621.1 hypothetical protein CEUSTIGMA_g77.t1 [Chlamydomonas eustigma]
MTSRTLFHTALAGCIGGVAMYVAADVGGDYTTYVILRNVAMQLAESNEGLKKQIGHPFSLGPWYNARIGFSAGRNIAQCSFQLLGQDQITDLTVRGVRRTGISSTLLYNIAGLGEWKVVECTAMFPSGGGLVKPQSLMPNSRPAEVCTTCEADNGQGDAVSVNSSTQPESSQSHTLEQGQSILNNSEGRGTVAFNPEGASPVMNGNSESEPRRRVWWRFGL